MFSFEHVLSQLDHPYHKRIIGNPSDTRELIALADLYVRIVYIFIILESHRSGDVALKVIPTPGVGTMLGIIKRQKSNHPSFNERASPNIYNCVDSFAQAIFDFKTISGCNSFVLLRNQLSHGGALPFDDNEANVIATDLHALCEKLRSVLKASFSGYYLENNDEGFFFKNRSIDDNLRLDPLWKASDMPGVFGVYSHFSSSSINYLIPGKPPISTKTEKTIIAFEKNFLAEKPIKDTPLDKLVKEVLSDVAAFTEDNSTPSYFFGEDSFKGNLFIPWSRPDSDGNHSRIDAFRIGRDNRYEWLESNKNEWVPYSQFLRRISNWPILARRIRISLEKFQSERNTEETSRFGTYLDDSVRGPDKLLEVFDDLSQRPSTNDQQLFNLEERADNACELFKPSTTVFFIVGAAGLGKTDLMLSLTKQRASQIEKLPQIDKPLYLFVSSTGRTLASLEDAVDSSLNITKILSSHSAKALCRNGLLVLLVDGFDELLGSSGYENALGSLEPWFRELGGRGVLVASARSSYYLTQYRRSLSETTINVDHTLAELQPWKREEIKGYLTQLQIPKNYWEYLDDRDWHLLSVPFFAKAFSAWHKAHKSDNKTPIFEIVVEQYLSRESTKLVDPHSGPLLDQSQLKSLFTEVAELMYLSKQRELESSDLVLCAQQAIDSEDIDREKPGLSRRLTALCGLAVNSDSATKKFSFSHEVMFDCFLSISLQKRIKTNKNFKSIRLFFESGNIHPTVFDRLVEWDADNACEIVQDFVKLTLPPNGWSSTISQNIGSLWMSLLKKKKGIPPTNNVNGLRLTKIELAETGWSSLNFEQCYIESLEIPRNGSFAISIPNSQVNLVQCEDKSQLAKTLKDVEPTFISAIHTQDFYVDTPTDIRKQLELLKIVPCNSDKGTQWIDNIKFFLGKVRSGIVIDAESYLTDNDPRHNWTTRLGNDEWVNFIKSLERNGIVELEPIVSGGSSKVRIMFLIPPAGIKNPIKLADEDQKKVNAFWNTQ